VPILYPDELARLADRPARCIPATGSAGRPARVVTVAAGPPATRSVLVARSDRRRHQGVHLLRITLLVAFPLLVALLAAVTWRVVGAALRPVEALRAGAEEITGGARSGRLPVPDSRTRSTGSR
jgi:hypothetical protein